jgi:4-hydroxyphenylpyruvate dioxygenase
LVIPENYYDDLDARIDLSPGALDQLRANNVLYDRQGAGEYFQAYTKSFGGGFVFEIVEPRAYTGFGAANAPIRLAAQTRECAIRRPHALRTARGRTVPRARSMSQSTKP